MLPGRFCFPVAISFQIVNIVSVVKPVVCFDMFLHYACQVVMKQNAVIEHLKQKKTMTPAEREENQRFVSRIWKFFEWSPSYVSMSWSYGTITSPLSHSTHSPLSIWLLSNTSLGGTTQHGNVWVCYHQQLHVLSVTPTSKNTKTYPLINERSITLKSHKAPQPGTDLLGCCKFKSVYKKCITVALFGKQIAIKKNPPVLSLLLLYNTVGNGKEIKKPHFHYLHHTHCFWNQILMFCFNVVSRVTFIKSQRLFIVDLVLKPCRLSEYLSVEMLV